MVDISERGIAFIKDFEGAKTLLPDGRYRSYLDTLAEPNVWTIYTGLTKGVGKDTVWSVDECEKRFARECSVYEDAIDRLVKVPLNVNQADALISFVYNCGVGAFQGSTLLKLLNQGKYEQAAAQFARWNKAGGKVWPGLVRRRAAEAALFLKPVEEDPIEIGIKIADEIVPVPSNAMPQRVEASKVGVATAIKESSTIKAALGTITAGVASGYNWLVSGAADASAEATKLKTSFSGWDALWSAVGLNMGLLLAGFVVIGGGIVLVRHLSRYQEGRA